MGLTKYRDKRQFSRTPEPEGAGREKKKTAAQAVKGLIYVIQKHHASHLHWDLRLEEEGVLKSWAVPKEPPNAEGVKRLAVSVEDHPLEYASFEGTIPAGEYGGGTVEIWDRGSYRILEATPTKRLIEIFGAKLRGSYALLKLKPKEDGDRNWLFFKTKTPVSPDKEK